jgi:transposase
VNDPKFPFQGDPGMTEYFIARDVHCAFSEMAVVTGSGKLVRRDRLETSIPALRTAIAAIPRPRRLTFEEGPLADWLTRELHAGVNELLVCEPRRNHWIACEGDKDDPVDARKLADLYRGGYLKEVHQAGSLRRSLLKQHVGLYHDRVRERVRQGHQLAALFRRHGVFLKAVKLLDDDEWSAALDRLPAAELLRRSLARVRQAYQLLSVQEESLREELIGLAKNEEPVRRFQELPGMGWIRSVTFYSYIDAPQRFRSKAALWRYAGIGLERRHSGQGPMRTRLSHRGHRRLKDALMGAAKSAIVQAANPFAEKHRHWTLEKGMPATNARRNVARAIAAALWSLWKTGQPYDPLRVTAASPLA